MMLRYRRSTRGGPADSGQATLEYVGALIASSVVVALVTAAFAIPASRQRVISTVGSAVCSLTGGTNCGSHQPGGSGTGSGGNGAGDAGSPGPAGTGQQPVKPAGNGDGGGCHGFLGCTWGGMKQVGSGLYNVGKGAVDDVVGVVDLVKNPSGIIDAGQYIWNNPWDAAKSLVWDGDSQKMADKGDYGGAVGRTIWNVGSWFIPGVDAGRAASKIGKFGKLTHLADEIAKLSKLADEAAGLAKKAEEAAARGDLGAAHKAAEEARSTADEAAKQVTTCALGAGFIPGQRGSGGVPGDGLVLADGFGGGGRLGSASVPVLRSAPMRAGNGDCKDAADQSRRAQEAADQAAASFAKAFQTTKDQAYFWSGRTDGVGGADRAAELAKTGGGTSLETLMAERNITMPTWDPANPVSLKAWDDASRAYAQGASGTVHAVLGDTMRPGSVWETIEFPALKNNPAVDRIIRVDPATGAETVLWER